MTCRASIVAIFYVSRSSKVRRKIAAKLTSISMFEVKLFRVVWYSTQKTFDSSNRKRDLRYRYKIRGNPVLTDYRTAMLKIFFTFSHWSGEIRLIKRFAN